MDALREGKAGINGESRTGLLYAAMRKTEGWRGSCLRHRGRLGALRCLDGRDGGGRAKESDTTKQLSLSPIKD